MLFYFGMIVAIVLAITTAAQASPTVQTLESLYQAQLAGVAELESLVELRTEYAVLSSLHWKCRKELEEVNLPLNCYRLNGLTRKSRFFSQAASEELSQQSETACDVALHHQSSKDLLKLRKKAESLPPQSLCRERALKHLNKLEYQAQSAY